MVFLLLIQDLVVSLLKKSRHRLFFSEKSGFRTPKSTGHCFFTDFTANPITSFSILNVFNSPAREKSIVRHPGRVAPLQNRHGPAWYRDLQF